MAKKMRCRRCQNLNYNFLTDRYENGEPFFCGLHGCARVDPDGEQQNLDHRGGCGFIPTSRPLQLELFK